MPDQLRVRIAYPHPRGTNLGPSFLAFGFCHPANAPLKFSLVELDGTAIAGLTITPATPALTPKPYDWGCFVSNVPTPSRPRLFQVEAQLPGGAGQAIVRERMVLRCGLPGHNSPPVITISYPTDGSAMPSTFDSYGTVDQPSTVTAILVARPPNTQRVVPGVPISPPDGMDWAFQFAGVHPGNWTVIITATNQQGESNSTSISISV